jgi:hypothetical protein
MKSLFVLALFTLGAAGVLRAQDVAPSPDVTAVQPNPRAAPERAASSPPAVNVAANFSSISVAKTAFSQPVSSHAFAQPAETAEPAKPQPVFLYGGRNDYRWQLGLGYAYVRFRANQFNVGMHGLNTSVVYYTNDWFGIEGNVSAAFGPTVFANERTKYLSFTGGPKIAWRQRRWEPWAHALFGVVHFLPQLAGFSRTSLGIVAGGGADYRWNPRVSFRLEGDWARSQHYNTSQNNFQFVTGVVFHF